MTFARNVDLNASKRRRSAGGVPRRPARHMRTGVIWMMLMLLPLRWRKPVEAGLPPERAGSGGLMKFILRLNRRRGDVSAFARARQADWLLLMLRPWRRFRWPFLDGRCHGDRPLTDFCPHRAWEFDHGGFFLKLRCRQRHRFRWNIYQRLLLCESTILSPSRAGGEKNEIDRSGFTVVGICAEVKANGRTRASQSRAECRRP